MDSAKSAYEKLIKRISSLKEDNSEIDKEQFENFNNQFKEAIGNDLNTSFAITTIFDVLKSDISNNTKIALIKDFDKVLSLDLSKAIDNEKHNDSANNQEIDSELKQYIEEMIEKRNIARQNKDYSTADSIRKELQDKGIELLDTKDSTSYTIK